MPRSGVNGTYTLPPNTDNQAPLTTISSAMFNAFADDVEQTNNTPVPIAYGGTNAATAAAARTNLGVPADTDVVKTVSQTLTSLQKGVASFNLSSGLLSGLRNKIINPLGNVNQRGVSGSVALPAGTYGHDRFKGGSAGCFYTFSTSGGVTTFNISGGSLVQVVEASCFSGGANTYYLSWSGTAQARINGGAYGSSGSISAVLDGTSDVSIEWGVGTFVLPQLAAEFVSNFANRHIQEERLLCRRYYAEQVTHIQMVAASVGEVVATSIPLPDMRTTPTVSVKTVTTNINTTSAALSQTFSNATRLTATSAAAGQVVFTANISAEAEI